MATMWVVEAWNEWQLRILVLGSLFLQFFLFFAAELRKFAISSWFRLCIWLAYLGSDALAIYALATLFNRFRHQDYSTAHGGSSILQVFWAPILLIHLGGQDSISAYNIEDNELWTRHVLSFVSQATVAVYVFCKSWSGTNTRLLKASILLFVAGVLKFSEKPWALKRASFNSLASSSIVVQKTRAHKEGDLSLKDYIRQAKKTVEHTEVARDEDKALKTTVTNLQVDPCELFVDLAAPYYCRLINLQSFLELDDGGAYRVLQAGFSSTFDFLYTKERKRSTCPGFLWWMSSFCLLTAALCLFAKSPKEGYDKNDVKITYVLISGALWMDVAALFPLLISFRDYRNNISNLTLQSAQEMTSDHERIGAAIMLCGLCTRAMLSWSSKVAQYNLIEFFVRNKNPTTKQAVMMCFGRFFGCEDYVYRLYVDYCYSSFSITMLVFQYVKEGWKGIQDVDTYRRFNDHRGHQTLKLEGCDRQLGWSTKLPFDESVLLWHVATDLCFRCTAPSPGEHATRCREMSNYMIYLLFVCPEMLMAGTRKDLFTTACDELKHMFKDDKPPLDRRELAQTVLDKVQSSSEAATRGLVHDSCKIAKRLLELDEEKRWKVIEGVWVEMLCYSACRCRGYLHAKSLGTGGEYLSYVWLLLSHLGMETFAERLQRPLLPGEGEDSDHEEQTIGAPTSGGEISPV